MGQLQFKTLGVVFQLTQCGEKMDKVLQGLLEAVKIEAPNGTLSCCKALELAEKLEVTPSEVGQAANDLKIKIVRCELGCF